ncbi:TPA: prepilin peptidase [Candidatus Woesearchaeota archaeon]|nr:prepilin peptidase [Candidatus Woesearchaeota archaeon]
MFETLLSLLSANFPIYIPILILTSIALIIASISDIRTREVPDLLNYSLIFVAIGLRAVYSATTGEWSFLVAGLIGLGVFFSFALVLFYAGQWGGGDSKLLMGMGAMFGIDLKFNIFNNNLNAINNSFNVLNALTDSFLLNFFVNMLVAGAVYGLIWSTVLAFKNRKELLAAFFEKMREKNIKLVRMIMFAAMFILLILAVFVRDFAYSVMLLSGAIIIYLTVYLWISTKAIEKVCMIKKLPPTRLTEGDWIAEDVYFNKKYICGPKDLGIEREQIALLKRLKVKFVLVKEGIPFIPSFLFGFLLTLAFGSWWIRVIA